MSRDHPDNQDKANEEYIRLMRDEYQRQSDAKRAEQRAEADAILKRNKKRRQKEARQAKKDKK